MRRVRRAYDGVRGGEGAQNAAQTRRSRLDTLPTISQDNRSALSRDRSSGVADNRTYRGRIDDRDGYTEITASIDDDIE